MRYSSGGAGGVSGHPRIVASGVVFSVLARALGRKLAESEMREPSWTVTITRWAGPNSGQADLAGRKSSGLSVRWLAAG